MVAERARFRPVAQIVGRRLFWGREFAVTGAVLDPRPGDRDAGGGGARRAGARATILDLGTGSGAILVTPARRVAGGARPRHRHRRRPRSRSRRRTPRGSGWRSGRASRSPTGPSGIGERFDLVVSNPPYIAAAEVAALAADVRDWEPRHALTPGPTGLEAYRAHRRRAAAGAGAGRARAPRDRRRRRARRSRRCSAAAGLRARDASIATSTAATAWSRRPEPRVRFPLVISAAVLIWFS